MTGRSSEALEATDQLPVGDGGVVRVHLDLRRVQVVLDDVLAERGPGQLAAREGRGGFRQRGRHRAPVGVVGVADEGLFQLQLVLDAVETGGDQRGDGEVRVDVPARHAVLDAQRLAVAY